MITTTESLSVISDAVLNAARDAVLANSRYHVPHRMPIGRRNQDLVVLLEALLDSALATATAIADNAWDEPEPVSAETIRDALQVMGQITVQIADLDSVPRRAQL